MFQLSIDEEFQEAGGISGGYMITDFKLDTPTIDFGFILQNENNKTSPYMLNINKYPSSGVTICMGVDLGATKSIDHWNIPNGVKEKLQPYVGLKGKEAKEAFDNTDFGNPLTKGECKEVDRQRADEIINIMIKQFNKASNTDFKNLDPVYQTVLADMAWQHGGELQKNQNFNIDEIFKEFTENPANPSRVWDLMTDVIKDMGVQEGVRNRFNSRRKYFDKASTPLDFYEID